MLLPRPAARRRRGVGEWKKIKLESAPLSIIDGDRGINYPSHDEFFDDGFCLFLSTKNVRKAGFDFFDNQFISKDRDALLRKGRLKRNDLVLTTRGTVGNLGFYDNKVKYDVLRINSGMVIIRPNPRELFPAYNYYLFRKMQNEFQTFVSGSAQPQLPIKDLKEIEILLPPLPGQRAIASVLSSLDDKIDLLRCQNQTLEAIAEILFRQYFVEEADEKAIGKIADLVDLNPSRRLEKGAIASYLEMANVSSQFFCPDEWYSREYSSGMKFINGDTLLARITPCLENGKSAFVTFLEKDQVGWGSTEFIVMRSKGNLHPLFSYALVRNRDFRDYAESCLAGSSGRQRIEIEHLMNYEIAIPTEQAILEFNQQMSTIAPKLHGNFLQIHTLEKTRNLLLPKLMSGEVQVEISAPQQSMTIATPVLETMGKHKAPNEFVEAVVIAYLVRLLASEEFPLGRKRYNKMAYLAHRKSADVVQHQYLKKAAGPYSPWAKYKGPERIAIAKGYIKVIRSGEYVGFVVGVNNKKIDPYLENYSIRSSLDWVTREFKRATNDHLELLATVDFAALDLLNENQQINVHNIKKIISSNEEWVQKLTRKIFSDENIHQALGELESLFPAMYRRLPYDTNPS